MKKSKFSEQQIVDILSKAEAGTSVNELCDSYHISMGTYYQWRSKYRNFKAPELTRLNQLEHRNRQLTRLYMQSVRQKEILQRAIEGKL